MTSPTIITDWTDAARQLFGRQPLRLTHDLARHELFSEETLADLIEHVPASHYNLTTMGFDHDNSSWTEGHLAGTPGKTVLETIRRGRMWLNLRALEEFDSRYRALAESIQSAFEDQIEGLRSFRWSLGILISSPGARVFYHADIPGQSLWQIAGHKRLFIYPNTEPFLKPEDMEKIVLGMTEEEIPFEPWFDDYARVYELGPGEMVHWPLNGPHQVINEDCLNISLTTSHWTAEVRNAYAVNYANGVLRQNFGYAPRSTRPTPLTLYPKAALALLWKKLNLQKGKRVIREIRFRIDPQSPTGISPLDPAPAE
ncbi:MAG: hypothetical protein D6773_04955 [Alphaproteobacteria bacterium]|nr:MAG: hypothetical protein D6773_04955 [Alphaproteobacteria bacterium]